MINQTLLWLLALPIVLAVLIWVFRREYAGAWAPALGFCLIALIVISTAFFVSKGGQVRDIEIWNGKVISKERVHDTYEQPYECFCTTSTDSNGNSTRTCQTCYETHYTVEWKCITTVGQYQIEKFDKTTRRVYDSPDPARWLAIKENDPVAKRIPYINYVQAVPNSLFTPASGDLKAKFKDLLPSYPDGVYDFYKVNRFLTPGIAVSDSKQWDDDISIGLNDIGPGKQVNLIVVVAKTDDVNYEYALTDHWEGANKNDVVLVLGSKEYPKLDFVRVISWTKKENFKVQLRDAVMDKKVIDRSIIPLVFSHIENNFERRRMREFDYLDGEIDPPDWLIYVLIGLIFVGAGGTCFYTPGLLGTYTRKRKY